MKVRREEEGKRERKKGGIPREKEMKEGDIRQGEIVCVCE